MSCSLPPRPTKQQRDAIVRALNRHMLDHPLPALSFKKSAQPKQKKKMPSASR